MLSKKPINLKIAIKAFISLGILALLVFHMDKDALNIAMKSVHVDAWFYALAFIILQLFILSFRWMLLINVGRYRMSYIDSVQVTLASLIANTLFIATISGIVVRVALAYQYGASLFKSIFATGMDRFMTLFALIALSAIFLPSLSNFVDHPVITKYGFLLSTLTITIFVFTPILVMSILNSIPHNLSENAKFRSGMRYLKLLFNNPTLIAKILLVSIIGQVSFFAAIYAVSLSVGVELSFLEIIIVLPAIAIASSLPMSFGGWGVREGAFVFGLGLLGVSMETAFSISIQIGLISLVATMVAGIPAVLANSPIFKIIKTS